MAGPWLGAYLTRKVGKPSTVIASGAPMYPYDFLAQGRRVRITSGPMRGIEGIIDRTKGNYRLLLQVETIARAIALNLDADMVEAA